MKSWTLIHDDFKAERPSSQIQLSGDLYESLFKFL